MDWEERAVRRVWLSVAWHSWSEREINYSTTEWRTVIESGVFVQTKLLGPCLDLDLEPTAEPGRIWRSIGSCKFLFPLAQYAMPEVNRSKTTSNVHNKPKLSKNFLSWHEKCSQLSQREDPRHFNLAEKNVLGLEFQVSILFVRKALRRKIPFSSVKIGKRYIQTWKI